MLSALPRPAATPHRATPPWRAAPSRPAALPCPALPCSACLPCLALSCFALSYIAMPCLALPVFLPCLALPSLLSFVWRRITCLPHQKRRRDRGGVPLPPVPLVFQSARTENPRCSRLALKHVAQKRPYHLGIAMKSAKCAERWRRAVECRWRTWSPP